MLWVCGPRCDLVWPLARGTPRESFGLSPTPVGSSPNCQEGGRLSKGGPQIAPKRRQRAPRRTPERLKSSPNFMDLGSFCVFVMFSACDGSTRPTRLRETHERPQERPQDMANSYGGRHERMSEYVTNWGGWLVAYLPDWGGCHLPPPAFLDSPFSSVALFLVRPPSSFRPPFPSCLLPFPLLPPQTRPLSHIIPLPLH